MANKLSLISLALNLTFHLFLSTASRILLTEEETPPPVLPPAPVEDPSATTSAAEASAYPDPPLSFFMHDILGGSAPSVRTVAGIIANANTQINGLPFSKPNGGRVFPINGGIPLLNANNAAAANNNGGGRNGNTRPFVAAGQLPAGATLQKLMFGTITVIDDELTGGHELGSYVVGKAQGFYLASSMDGSSQSMAFTALFYNGEHGEEEEDSISFFGVHRTAAIESEVAIVGGSGKYENAKGYAMIETLHLGDQHITDGVETILHISVYPTH